MANRCCANGNITVSFRIRCTHIGSDMQIITGQATINIALISNVCITSHSPWFLSFINHHFFLHFSSNRFTKPVRWCSTYYTCHTSSIHTIERKNKHQTDCKKTTSGVCERVQLIAQVTLCHPTVDVMSVYYLELTCCRS